jgi:hypothetical protein
MENLPVQECVVAKSPMTADVCKSLSFNNRSYLVLNDIPDNGNDINPIPGTQRKFSLDTFKEIVLASS